MFIHRSELTTLMIKISSHYFLLQLAVQNQWSYEWAIHSCATELFTKFQSLTFLQPHGKQWDHTGVTEDVISPTEPFLLVISKKRTQTWLRSQTGRVGLEVRKLFLLLHLVHMKKKTEHIVTWCHFYRIIRQSRTTIWAKLSHTKVFPLLTTIEICYF